MAAVAGEGLRIFFGLIYTISSSRLFGGGAEVGGGDTQSGGCGEVVGLGTEVDEADSLLLDRGRK